LQGGLLTFAILHCDDSLVVGEYIYAHDSSCQADIHVACDLGTHEMNM